MSAGKFWILIFLALMIAGLVALEVISDSQVVALTDALSSTQAAVARVQQQQEILREMVQKLVIASQTDADLAVVLSNHGVHINRSSPPQDAGTPNAAATKVPASTPPATN